MRKRKQEFISHGTRALRERRIKRIAEYEKRLQERLAGVPHALDAMRAGVARKTGIDWRAGR